MWGVNKMPTLCKYENCRGHAVYGYYKYKPLYCSEHRLPDTKNAKFIDTVGSQENNSNKCNHAQASTKYKGYCVNCYVNKYPDDPLSFQSLYKSKIIATQKFIDARFDGFNHGPNFSEININNKTLRVEYVPCGNNESGIILIQFQLNKYENGSNPQLYTRLPKLEQLIAEHMENIILTN